MSSPRTTLILALFILLPAVVLGQSTGLTLTADTAGVSAASLGGAATIFHVQTDTSSGGSQPAGYATLSYSAVDAPTSFVWFQTKHAVGSGRLYAETTPGAVGVAFTNPNSQAVTVTFFFTDASGTDFGRGSFSLLPQEQMARFITEAPFSAPGGFRGTLTYMASLPIALIAVRGLINESGGFLMPEVPVAEFGSAATTIVPDFIDGTDLIRIASDPPRTFTELILVNVTDSTLTGSFTFYGSSTDATTPAQPVAVTINGQTMTTFRYTIPPRSSRRFVTAGNSMQEGSIHVQPDASSPPAPQAFSILNSLGPVTAPTAIQTTITGQAPGTAFRLPVQCPFRLGILMTCSSRTAIKITNPASIAASVSFDSPGLNVSSTITVPAHGHTTVFPEALNPALQSTLYLGTIRVSSSSPISVVGLQIYSRFNSYAAIPAFDELNAPAPLFPHLALNGGYGVVLQLIKTFDTQPSMATIHFFSRSGSELDPKTIGLNQPGSLQTGPSSINNGSTVSDSIGKIN
jgi:hypothetical protein